MPLIQELLMTQLKITEDVKIPEVLFDDWSRDDVAGSEDFSRGGIRYFRDSDEETREDILKSWTSN